MWCVIRDNNLTEAAEFATILVNSTNDLDTKVNDTSLFNSDVAFAGMMALANEVKPLACCMTLCRLQNTPDARARNVLAILVWSLGETW